MIIVNDNVFNTDVGQPHIKHGTLDPAADFAMAGLVDLPVGTLYISKTAITGQPCGTTVTAACLWVKEGTAGSACAPAGSKSDWRRVGTCGGFTTGTAAINPSASPWCEAERGDVYAQTITGQTWVIYHMKVANDCGAAWVNLSKGCVFEDTHTPVGSMDADLCMLPVSSFIHVDGLGTYIKVKNNCDGNDWVPLQTDLAAVEDMRIVTTLPNDAVSGKPTYTTATRTLNIPPRVVIALRRDLVTAGPTVVTAGSTSVIDFDTVDLDTSQNNAGALALNAITVPFDGLWRVTSSVTLVGKAAEYLWRVVPTFNGSLLQEYRYEVFPGAESLTTNTSDSWVGPLVGGTQLGIQLVNKDTTDSTYNSVHLTAEHLGT